jgi:hypothetical protein
MMGLYRFTSVGGGGILVMAVGFIFICCLFFVMRVVSVFF